MLQKPDKDLWASNAEATLPPDCPVARPHLFLVSYPGTLAAKEPAPHVVKNRDIRQVPGLTGGCHASLNSKRQGPQQPHE